MWDLVGNPENRFSHKEARLQRGVNVARKFLSNELMVVKKGN